MGPISEEDMVCMFSSPIFRHFLTHWSKIMAQWNKANCCKASKSKYSSPKSAHNLNLTPTENQGLNLDQEQSNSWLWQFLISLKLLNWNWGSHFNDEQILDYILYLGLLPYPFQNQINQK